MILALIGGGALVRKRLQNAGLLEQAAAQGLQGFAQAAFDAQFLLHGGHQHVRAHGDPDLHLRGADRRTVGGLGARQPDRAVAARASGLAHVARGSASVDEVAFGADDEEGQAPREAMEPRKVGVAEVHRIERPGLDGHKVQHRHICHATAGSVNTSVPLFCQPNVDYGCIIGKDTTLSKEVRNEYYRCSCRILHCHEKHF